MNIIDNYFNNKIILVTGCAGFIGAALCIELIRSGKDVNVIGIDNLNDYYDVSLKKWRLDRISGEDSSKRFVFCKGDIADKHFIQDVFDRYKPEVVVNLAAQAGVRYSVTNPDIYIKSNLVGFFNILEACRHSYDIGYAGVRHLIMASSSSVYGDSDVIPYTTGNNTDKPVSLYAATKKSNELLAYSYSKLYNIPTTALRFFTVYGPAGRPDMAYFTFTNRMINGEKIRIFNYGKCERDFTYIDDIVEGVMRVIGSPYPVHENDIEVPYRVYNIGNSHPENIVDFVKVLQNELIRAGVIPSDYDLEKNMELTKMQPGDVAVTYADTSDFERDFDFKPGTSINVGLRRFAEWYKEFYRSDSVVTD